MGDFYVPTWDFGDIARGQSVTRTLSFIVDGAGLDPADPRAELLVNPDRPDLLANRTTSLKISTWIDNLTADTGIAYPQDPLRGSDASVFHNIPEPTMMVLLGLGRCDGLETQGLKALVLVREKVLSRSTSNARFATS